MATTNPMPSRATPEGTARFAQRPIVGEGSTSPVRPAPGHFRLAFDRLSLSSIGLGTYLGDPNLATDRRYVECSRMALKFGCNAIDTAINYRFQRSERSIGAALAEVFAQDELRREEIVVATKGGYLSFDGNWPDDPEAWVMDTFIRPGIASPEDFVESHCMAPAYLTHQIGQSRANLGLECIDLYYLHNPEGQRPVVGADEFNHRVRAAFEALEAAVARGEIAAYGMATWNGYRRPPNAPDHLSLQAMLMLAREVAGAGHHFRAIQLPYNFSLAEAYGAKTQLVDGQLRSPLEAAAQLGVTVFASASLMQSRLAFGLPDPLRMRFAGLQTDAQRAIQLARSTPGVTTALVGMSRPEHVKENLRLARVPPVEPEAIAALFR